MNATHVNVNNPIFDSPKNILTQINQDHQLTMPPTLPPIPTNPTHPPIHLASHMTHPTHNDHSTKHKTDLTESQRPNTEQDVSCTTYHKVVSTI
jgi:hypothetical protein